MLFCSLNRGVATGNNNIQFTLKLADGIYIAAFCVPALTENYEQRNETNGNSGGAYGAAAIILFAILPAAV